MVQTRQSAAFSPQPELQPVKTPQQKVLEDLTTCLEQLRKQDGIHLPNHDWNSPSKRRKSPGHDASYYISVLTQKDPDALSDALAVFRLESPRLPDTDSKLNRLRDILHVQLKGARDRGTFGTPCRSAQVATSFLTGSESHHVEPTSMNPPPVPNWSKPISASKHWPPPSLECTELEDIAAPPSPSPSGRRASQSRLSDVAAYPKLPPQIQQQCPINENTSVNTSFATTVTNISFWSEPQGSQEPASQATSVASLSFMDGANDVPDRASDQADLLNTPMTTSQSDRHFSNPAVSNGQRHGDTKVSTVGVYKFHGGMSTNELAQNQTMNTITPFKQQEQPEQQASTKLAPAKLQASGDQNLKTTAGNSPGRLAGENVRVAAIPGDGIRGKLQLPYSIAQCSFAFRLECARAIQGWQIPPSELETQLQGREDFEYLQCVANDRSSTYQTKLAADYKDSSLRLKLRWTDSKEKDGPLFVPELLPPARLDMNSFQQKFGADRFLFVEVDPLAKPPEHLCLTGQKDNISRRFLEMLGQEQEFLGRRWLQFHVEVKKPKKTGDADDRRIGALNLIFVALEGDNGKLPPLKLWEVVGWALPFAENAETLWCKVFARLDLRISRTSPLLTLSSDEIMRVRDDLATNEAPDARYNNKSLEADFATNEMFFATTVMNDGCSEVPQWILRQIMLKHGLDNIPAAAQFRLAGAKGMMFMRRPTDDEYEHPDRPPAGAKFFITDSQLKLNFPNPNGPFGNDPYYNTLQINTWIRPPGTSLLYLDFLPILVACGVPFANIETLVSRQLDEYEEKVMSSLKSRKAFELWLNNQRSILEEQQQDSDTTEIAGFPRAPHDKAIRMLRAGFEPTVFPPLARQCTTIISSWADRMKKTFKPTLPQSTMVYAVVDCTGTLKPGEFHLCFSTPQRDRMGRACMSVEGPALIGRNPAANPWDIQKLTGVRKPELSHLIDALVFSGRGPRPPADKMSGGDHDGDMFWVTWEPLLVLPFENRPALQNLPGPKDIGITVDESPLNAIVNDPTSEEQVREFVRMGTANRLKIDLLGVMTRIHTRAAYKHGIFSKEARVAARGKDLLMDSDKNGYSFDNQALVDFKKNNNLEELPIPAYFEFTVPKEEVDGFTKYELPNTSHIVDRIFFKLLKPKFDKIRDDTTKVLSIDRVTYDDDLTAFYDDLAIDSRNDDVVKQELAHLRKQFLELRRLWKKHMDVFFDFLNANKSMQANKAWETAVIGCSDFYKSIEPSDTEDKELIREMRRRRGKALTNWDYLKASMLARECGSGKMYFHVAASDLCQIKADAEDGSVTTRKDSYADLVRRKERPKRKHQEMQAETSSDAWGDHTWEEIYEPDAGT